MALMYPWATKEYLLWEMSLAQLVLYHNIGIDIKYPKPGSGDPSLENMSKTKKEQAIAEAKEIWAKAQAEGKPDPERDRLRDLYGDIDG